MNAILTKITLLASKAACLLVVLMFANMMRETVMASPDSNGEYIALGIGIMTIATFFFFILLVFSIAAKGIANKKWYKTPILLLLLVLITIPIIALLLSPNFGLL